MKIEYPGRRGLWEPQIEKLARDAIVRRLATEKLDDNNDMVKLINSLGASAAAFMIRDEQVTMLVGCILERDYGKVMLVGYIKT